MLRPMARSGAPRVPRGRPGLVFKDHSKRGRRWVTALDPVSQDVTLLEPWEHAVLSFCDGVRSLAELERLVSPSWPETESATPLGRALRDCLRRLHRAGLLEATAASEAETTLLSGASESVPWGSTSDHADAGPFRDAKAVVSAGLSHTIVWGAPESEDDAGPDRSVSQLIHAVSDDLGAVDAEVPDTGPAETSVEAASTDKAKKKD